MTNDDGQDLYPVTMTPTRRLIEKIVEESHIREVMEIVKMKKDAKQENSPPLPDDESTDDKHAGDDSIASKS